MAFQFAGARTINAVMRERVIFRGTVNGRSAPNRKHTDNLVRPRCVRCGNLEPVHSRWARKNHPVYGACNRFTLICETDPPTRKRKARR